MKIILSVIIGAVAFFSLSADEYGFPDPYPEVYTNTEVLPLFLHGWKIYDTIIPGLIKDSPPNVVIEVGAWTGKWTTYIATQITEGGKVFAVDHWKGSQEHYNIGSTEHALLPTLFQQFLSNVIHCGLTDKIIPVRMTSLKAVKKFKLLGIKADMIYIDASHDYRSVLADLEAWYPIINKGGLFCGDDWGIWPSKEEPLGPVSKAVIEFAEKNKLTLRNRGSFWWIEQ